MNDVSRNPKTREVQALSVIFLVSDSLSVTQHPLSSPSRRKLIVTEVGKSSSELKVIWLTACSSNVHSDGIGPDSAAVSGAPLSIDIRHCTGLAAHFHSGTASFFTAPHWFTQGMSPWTKVLNGGNREDTTPLLPDSDPPDLHRERDSSAPVAASSSPVDEYPDPVKPGREPQHASHHGYPV